MNCLQRDTASTKFDGYPIRVKLMGLFERSFFRDFSADEIENHEYFKASSRTRGTRAYLKRH